MPEIKLTGKPLDQRIADRRKSSGDGSGAEGEVHGRTVTHLHHNAGVEAHRESGGIDVHDKEALRAEYHRRKMAGE
jgi:hypothetical protein